MTTPHDPNFDALAIAATLSDGDDPAPPLPPISDVGQLGAKIQRALSRPVLRMVKGFGEPVRRWVPVLTRRSADGSSARAWTLAAVGEAVLTEATAEKALRVYGSTVTGIVEAIFAGDADINPGDGLEVAMNSRRPIFRGKRYIVLKAVRDPAGVHTAVGLQPTEEAFEASP